MTFEEAESAMGFLTPRAEELAGFTKSSRKPWME
jgi:hypothetical protein